MRRILSSHRLTPAVALTLLLIGSGAEAQLRPLARVRGTVHDSLRAHGPLAGARIVIQGLVADALTDSRGRFDFREVPVGPHRITFFHPWLDSLRLSAPVYDVELTEAGIADLQLAVPSFASLTQYLCGAPQDSATTVLFGQVRAAEDGAPLAGAEARVEWFELSLGGPEGLLRRNRVASALSDETGSYTLCGVPNDIENAMRVATGEQTTGPLFFTLAGAPVAYRDVTISLTDPAAARRLETDSVSDSLVTGTARLTVEVRDDRGRPVKGADVGVRGAPLSSQTDEMGRARLLSAPAGSQTVVVRAVGRAPILRVADLAPGAETRLELAWTTSVTVLSEVVVRGIRPGAELEAYERRRRSGAGRFLDAAELKRRGGGVNALFTVPGVSLQPGRRGDIRPMPLFRASGYGYCRPMIVVDGMQLPRLDGWELDAMLREAARVEVYTRPLLVPLDLMVLSSCGVIAIWTR
ncbi:MAG: carboxypeptidase regulatory-like domain-containing protein [Gemmatimonadota bacterium]|nr:carboxypeptidase regulatory-like domain-containing protein [Gemmatimonadota bacterium]